MPDGPRFVPDTNVLISRSVSQSSVPAQAVRKAITAGELLVCTETLEELEAALFRTKFDKYVTVSERLAFFDNLRLASDLIESVAPISACRDPRDDKFLALALTGRADFILTGHDDLLAMHPFCGIDILTPRQYLDRQNS